MNNPEQYYTALFNIIGRTLIAIQALDYSLCHYLAIWSHKSREEALAILEKSFKKVLGVLLQELKSNNITPDGCEQRLNRYLHERNWFVHHLYAKNWENVLGEESCLILCQRIDALRIEAKALGNMFTDLNERWCLNHGSTPDDIQNYCNKTLKEMIDRQHTPPGQASPP